MLTLAFGYHEDRTPTHGYAATREAAMAAFAKSWRRESEPIREVLESDESDVIPCRALDSLLRSARCGHPNTALRRTAVAFVTPVI